MPFKKFGLLIFALSLILASCKKDPEITKVVPTVTAYEIPQKTITASLSGTVVLEDGSPLEGASVFVGNESLTTDENGAFFFKNVKMNEYGTFVKVEKQGYFIGAKMVNPKAAKRSTTRIMLLEKTMVGSFTSTQGGTVDANGSSKISLPANAVMTKAGAAYTGQVNVFAKWMNPTASNLGEMMPGDLRAINSEEKLVQLATYGMLAIELEGAGGEALQIATGSKANLEFPVPAELQTNAPSTIPLWYFNEDNGHWVQEGEASFDGTKYVGEVAHFSFWNCDDPYTIVQLEGTIIDQDGNPIPDQFVRITINSNAEAGYGYTDEDGVFSGAVPKDEELTITISAYGWCESELYTASIGPFSSDAVLPSIVIDLNNVDNGTVLSISGEMVDCDGNKITNGYLKVYKDGNYSLLYPNEDGDIDATLFYCDVTTLDLEGYDFDGLKKSSVASYNVDGLTELDFGSLNVCDNIDEFLNYSIDGNDFFSLDPSAGFGGGNGMYINGVGNTDTSYVNISLNADMIGVYNPTYASFSGEDTANNTFYSAFCQGCSDFEVTITALGAVGEFMEGTFTGTMPGNTGGSTSTVTGAFKVTREN